MGSAQGCEGGALQASLYRSLCRRARLLAGSLPGMSLMYADMVWAFAGMVDAVVFAAPTTDGFDSLRTFAHRAFCAKAIFRRDAAEIIRFGWFVW